MEAGSAGAILYVVYLGDEQCIYIATSCRKLSFFFLWFNGNECEVFIV